ncbi:hypothetical protein V6615_14905 [Oscillospiraceae bacterium PP1C4]
MKKMISLCLVLIALLSIATGCAKATDTATSPPAASSAAMPKEEPSSLQTEQSKSSKEVIEITEKMYLTWINEIYTNPEEYLGKTIKIEGMFATQEYEGNSHYYVYRVGPGCCGNDGSMCGFEFTTSGILPNENDWIAVSGTLDKCDENGIFYFVLTESSVAVLDKRGDEVIS